MPNTDCCQLEEEAGAKPKQAGAEATAGGHPPDLVGSDAQQAAAEQTAVLVIALRGSTQNTGRRAHQNRLEAAGIRGWLGQKVGPMSKSEQRAACAHPSSLACIQEQVNLCLSKPFLLQ